MMLGFDARLRELFPMLAEHITEAKSLDLVACLNKTRPHVATSVLKTLVNAWCTSARMHEVPRCSCIFGCDEVVHSPDSHTTWSAHSCGLLSITPLVHTITWTCSLDLECGRPAWSTSVHSSVFFTSTMRSKLGTGGF